MATRASHRRRHMHPPDFFLLDIPMYLHPWVRFGEVLHMLAPGPEFGSRPILLVSEETVTYWMTKNVAQAYWPEGVNPDWVRLR